MTEPPDLITSLEAYRDLRLSFILECSQRLEFSIVVAVELQAVGTRPSTAAVGAEPRSSVRQR